MRKNLFSIFGIVLVLLVLVSCGAKKYKVTFDLNGGEGDIKDLTIEEGLLLNIPDVPTKDGFVFDYWQEKESGEKWNFGKDKVTKNITLVAQWKEPEPNVYNVKFFSLEGLPEPEDQSVVENDKVIKPADPVKEGYKFLGWFLAEETIPYSFNRAVTTDLILFAKWEEIIYVTVSFNTLGGTPQIADVVKEQGEKVSKPADPVKDGHTFVGWYLNDVLYDFNKALTNDITLTAKWEKVIVYYDVSFVVDSNPPIIINVEEGEKVDKPEDPVKDGYKFKGWYLEDEIFDFDTLIETDLVITAVWQKEHLVKFYLDEELTIEHDSEIVLDGDLANIPDEPEMIGYEFLGWYVGIEEYDFLDAVSKDLNIVAKWAKEHVVVFYLNDELTETHAQYIVIEGNKVTKPADPTKEFNTFLGWYLEDEEFDFDLLINDSYSIVAKWEYEGFVARAYIEDVAYQSISLALESAVSGDVILLTDETHNYPFTVSINNLTFKPKNEADKVVINAKITLASGLNGVTFEGLHFTEDALIHAPGAIDNFVFNNNNVYNLNLAASPFTPANRIDVNAFIRFYTIAGSDVVGNVTITNNKFSGIEADIISLARTSVNKEIILTDNEFTNFNYSAIRFDGGYNNGTYIIKRNIFSNDLDTDNYSVIVFRAYSSSSGNKQIVEIEENSFINVGSTVFPISDTHPGSGVILFSTYNENETSISIKDNSFINTSNSIHFRDNRGEHTNLSLDVSNNLFEDSKGFIFYESNYRPTDSKIVFDNNIYKVDGVETDITEKLNRVND